MSICLRLKYLHIRANHCEEYVCKVVLLKIMEHFDFIYIVNLSSSSKYSAIFHFTPFDVHFDLVQHQSHCKFCEDVTTSVDLNVSILIIVCGRVTNQ